MTVTVYTADEVAEMLRTTPQTIRRMLTDEKLKGFKVGREWRITEGDLEAFIDTSRQGGSRSQGQ